MRLTSIGSLVLVLAPLSQAQVVTATATIRDGCSVAAPVDSLAPDFLSPPRYLPLQDGRVAMECEQATLAGDWVEEQIVGGYSGESYLRWNGPNLFGVPGVGVLEYEFDLATSGDYVIRLWSQQNNGDSTSDNDCWIRLDGGPWEKLFGFQVGYWNPNAVLESTSDLMQSPLSVGLHRIELSGRSTNFKIDRLEVIPFSLYWADINQPTSERIRQRPLLGNTFSVLLDDPQSQSGLGSSANAWAFAGRFRPSNPTCVPLPAFGDLLVVPPIFEGPFLAPWRGPGRPARFSFSIPGLPSLAGERFTVQGALALPGQMRFTQAVDLRLGDI